MSTSQSGEKEGEVRHDSSVQGQSRRAESRGMRCVG